MPSKDRLVANLVIVSFFVVSLVLPVMLKVTQDRYPTFSALLREKVCNPLRSMTGIISFWDLFSVPRDKNFHYTAIISFSDGSTKYYEFPRPQKMGYWERFQKEKQRKVFYDCMNSAFSRPLLSSFANYLADANANPSNPPKRIVFMNHWADTPSARIGSIRDKLPEHTQVQSFFEYDCQLVRR